MPKTAAAKRASRYDVHPSVAMFQKWFAELKPKTGRTLEEWIAFVQKEGPAGFMPRRSRLMSKH